MTSGNAAMSALAWGNAPGNQFWRPSATQCRQCESRFQRWCFVLR